MFERRSSKAALLQPEPVTARPAVAGRHAGTPHQLLQRQRITQCFGEAATPAATSTIGRRDRLPAELRAGVESLSGLDLSSVRVHRNSSTPAQLNALAYAQGSDIHLGPGQEKHLPHEAWHVVQQMQGRVRPTLQAAGAPINDDPALEREADRMGARAKSSANGVNAARNEHSIHQRKSIVPIDAGNFSGSSQAVQMKRLGYVPANPGNFRGTTTIGYVDDSGTPSRDKPFNNSQRPHVYANNIANGGGAAPVLLGGIHPRSDEGGAALLDRSIVTPIEPEIDHIVPRASGGANDFDNARVISKAQNTNGNVPRPAAGQRALRAYEDFSIGPTDGMVVDIAAGALITLEVATELATYIDVDAPAVVGGFSNGELSQLEGAAPGNQNGITFN